MKNMKVLLSVLLALAMVLGTTAAMAEGFSVDVLEVKIWDNNQLAGLQQIADEWTAQSGVKVNIQVVDWGNYWTLLEAGASGGDMPDVFWMHSNNAEMYMNAGKLLDLYLNGIGLDRKENIYIANMLKCRPPQNRDPKPEEAEQCLPYLREQVRIMQPKILVLDEPTAMLDPVGRREVISTVLRLCRERGMTVILITHHMDECVDADRLIVMSNARVVLDGTPGEVFSDVERMEEEGLDVPETVRLLYDLNREGCQLPRDALSPDACASAVVRALRAREGLWQS